MILQVLGNSWKKPNLHLQVTPKHPHLTSTMSTHYSLRLFCYIYHNQKQLGANSRALTFLMYDVTGVWARKRKA